MRFEDTLQRVVAERDAAALVALSATVDLMADVLAHHRLQNVEGRHPGKRILPAPLLVAAGGERNGRLAVVKCTKWAVKTWVNRAGSAAAEPSSGGSSKSAADVRACLAMSRLVSEAVDAFALVVGEEEACSVVSIELENHCATVGSSGGAVDWATTALGRQGLMRAMSGHRFLPRLAKMMLEKMPDGKQEGKKMEELAMFLRRQTGGFHLGAVSSKKNAKRDMREKSGSAVLLRELHT